MSGCDATHDPSLRSWVASARNETGETDFPIQNLPLGVFSPLGGAPRCGVAIGDCILDIAAAAAAGLLPGIPAAAETTELNALLALGAPPRQALRARLSALLAEGAPEQAALARMLHPSAACTLHLPVRIGDYTDFYASLHHAANVGRMSRPDAPLTPNFRHMPLGYHGRASSVRPSGAAVRRPNGQRKSRRETEPGHGPSRNLDFELELGIWIGPGSTLGEPVPIGAAADHIAGYCLVNDWSARDIQAWEAQPLGPFLGKSFITSVSPWIVTPEALAPFRLAPAARAPEEPAVPPTLRDAADQAAGGLDIAVEAFLLTAAMRARNLPPERITASSTRALYWTASQLVSHQASGGCDLRPGDLLASGTLSGPEAGMEGSLLEITRGGRAPLTLSSGETRRFLEDGDEVVFRARASRAGFATIGFGELRGRVLPAI